MIKKIYITLIFLTIAFCSFSIGIYIADLNIYPESFDIEITQIEGEATTLLYNLIKKEDYSGLLNINLISNIKAADKPVIKSSIDASELCELMQINYLVYGHIKKTYEYYDAEIKIFDNEKKEVRKIFYEKAEIGNINELINSLSKKCTAYLYEILGLNEAALERKRGFGGINIYNSAGYWVPIGEWWTLITGLVTIETGLIVTPLNHFVRKRNFGFYLRFGVIPSYSLAMNKPDYLKALFHSVTIKISTDACFEFFNKNVFTIGFGPQLQLDILYQEKLYDDPYINTTIAFSLYTSIGYEHWFFKTENFAIGINNVFDFTFYNNFYMDYKIYFYTAYKIKLSKKSKK